MASSGDYNSVDKLSSIGLSGKLKISDGTRTNNENDVQKTSAMGRYIEEEEEEEEDELSEDELLAQMGYAKSTPKSEKINKPQMRHSDKENEEEEDDILEESFSAQTGYLKNEPITTPSELNLVSAFKGSREKEVVSSNERRVSWAPDVYDPPPTSDDHFTVNKMERHKSEHKVKGVAGKNRQKDGCKKAGASEGELGGSKVKKVGGKGKDKEKKRVDKKQAKKRGGSSSSGSNFSEIGKL